MCVILQIVQKNMLTDLTKTISNNHQKQSIHSAEFSDIFRPYASAQFTLIKTDQNANVKWGVRFYRS